MNVFIACVCATIHTCTSSPQRHALPLFFERRMIWCQLSAICVCRPQVAVAIKRAHTHTQTRTHTALARQAKGHETSWIENEASPLRLHLHEKNLCNGFRLSSFKFRPPPFSMLFISYLSCTTSFLQHAWCRCFNSEWPEHYCVITVKK